jgi:hypothetical protein
VRAARLARWTVGLAAALLIFTPPGDGAVSGPIDLSAIAVTRASLPFGPPGRRSDRVEEVWRLRDRRGRDIGDLYLTCRWITRFNRYCNAAVEMPLGQLTMSGVSPTSFFFEYAVTGGTEFYRGAEGDAQFTVTGARRMIMQVTLT